MSSKSSPLPILLTAAAAAAVAVTLVYTLYPSDKKNDNRRDDEDDVTPDDQHAVSAADRSVNNAAVPRGVRADDDNAVADKKDRSGSDATPRMANVTIIKERGAPSGELIHPLAQQKDLPNERDEVKSYVQAASKPGASAAVAPEKALRVSAEDTTSEVGAPYDEDTVKSALNVTTRKKKGKVRPKLTPVATANQSTTEQDDNEEGGDLGYGDIAKSKPTSITPSKITPSKITPAKLRATPTSSTPSDAKEGDDIKPPTDLEYSSLSSYWKKQEHKNVFVAPTPTNRNAATPKKSVSSSSGGKNDGVHTKEEGEEKEGDEKGSSGSLAEVGGSREEGEVEKSGDKLDEAREKDAVDETDGKGVKTGMGGKQDEAKEDETKLPSNEGGEEDAASEVEPQKDQEKEQPVAQVAPAEDTVTKSEEPVEANVEQQATVAKDTAEDPVTKDETKASSSSVPDEAANAEQSEQVESTEQTQSSQPTIATNADNSSYEPSSSKENSDNSSDEDRQLIVPAGTPSSSDESGDDTLGSKSSKDSEGYVKIIKTLDNNGMQEILSESEFLAGPVAMGDDVAAGGVEGGAVIPSPGVGDSKDTAAEKETSKAAGEGSGDTAVSDAAQTPPTDANDTQLNEVPTATKEGGAKATAAEAATGTKPSATATTAPNKKRTNNKKKKKRKGKKK